MCCCKTQNLFFSFNPSHKDQKLLVLAGISTRQDAHTAWEPSHLPGRREGGRKKTGLQGAAIAAHASGGTWTLQTAQQQLFFKQLPSRMPFFFGLWQTLPSWAGACQARLLCLLVSKREAKARAESFTELLRESSLCELMS